jgi:hypothetical protein
MRWIAAAVLLAVIAAPVAVIALVAAALEDEPVVAPSAKVTPEQVGRAKRLLAAHDPRKARPGALRSFALSAEDLELALNATLARHEGAAKVAMAPGAMMLWVSVRVPDNPFGPYLNVQARARQTSALPELDALTVGRVPVPAPLANWLLARALARLDATDAGIAAADALESVRFEGDFLRVEYRWRDDLPQRLRTALLPAAEQERLRAYQERLARIAADPKLPRQVSLVALMRPLLAHAGERPASADAVAENRAALLVLAFYVNGRGLAAVVPQARYWPRPQPRKVTLSTRGDFAQHFTVSAALAASAGTPLADAVGLYKEIEDSRGGSGFSFADIAADRAGTVFGRQATRSPQAAQQLQRRLASRLDETDVMPAALDLPEMLEEAELQRRFGGVDGPKYREVMQLIERRLAALPLYR